MNVQYKKVSLILYALSSALISTAVFAVSDSDISIAVKSRLQTTPNVSAANIDVTTSDGIVSLSGKVATSQQADNAVQAANSVAGVKDVKADNLSIADSSKMTSDTMITAKIKGAFVKEKLFGDVPVNVTGITVTTNNGVVYLSGDADSNQQIQTAISIAKKIDGVKEVKSTVIVKQ